MTINRTPIHVNDAVAKLMERVKPLNTETVSYNDSYGRVLAKDLTATSDVPLFTKSAMDGFAINSKHSKGASGDKRIAFKVVAEVPAGSSSDYVLKENEAFRIMTGAEIPESADTVVMFEQTKETDDGFTVRREFKSGENIAQRGEECLVGDVIVEKGTMINPGTVATLATFGYSEVEVFRQPVAGVLSTGTELLEVEDELERGKIRNSNTPMVLGQLKRMGIEGKHYNLRRMISIRYIRVLNQCSTKWTLLLQQAVFQSETTICCRKYMTSLARKCYSTKSQCVRAVLQQSVL